MEFSPQQDAALRDVGRWLRDPSAQQIYRLFGYAGTGKTTLARHFAEQNLDEEEVLFGAYTGKAALVLRQKGCPGASTLHSMLYHPKERSRYDLSVLEDQLEDRREQCSLLGLNPDEDSQCATLRRKIKHEKAELSKPLFDLDEEAPLASEDVRLLVVDECSMVDRRLAGDILSFQKKVLVLGDPAQLPPVRGEGFFTEAEPDTLLTEIHRQARDNPIIHLATRARQGLALEVGCYGNSEVIRRYDPGIDLSARVMAADQVLVGRNRTRTSANAKVRRLLGYGDSQMPIKNDKLVCLRNNHELGLLNGSLWNVLSSEDCWAGSGMFDLEIEPRDFNGAPFSVSAWAYPFLGEDANMSWWERKEAEEFDFGYALTVHKSQGSQWDSVVVLDESTIAREAARRHLYTAITRAAERVTVVKGYA